MLKNICVPARVSNLTNGSAAVADRSQDTLDYTCTCTDGIVPASNGAKDTSHFECLRLQQEHLQVAATDPSEHS